MGVMAFGLRLLALLALAACSAKSPPRGEAPPPRPPETPAQAGAVEPALPPPDPREVKLAAVTRELLEEGHLLRRPMDDALSQRAFALYLERLDPGKMFLLREDADRLARHATSIDDQVRSGRLELAHEGAATFAARLAELDTFVQATLAAPLDHTDEEWLELDADELALAADLDELHDRWRRRLELEVLERVFSMEVRAAGKTPGAAEPTPAPPPKDPIPATPEAREAKARADLAQAYSGRFARLRAPGKLDAAADLLNAVAAAYDPHTSYLPPADEANFNIQMTGSLEGIGAVLREKDHYIEIVELVPGGASWRDGRLDPGDLILSVANEREATVDVVDMPLDQVVKMIRGPKGTVVRLQIQKPTGVQQTVAITRDVVVIEEAYARGAVLQAPGARAAYGYIFLPSFYGGRGPGQRTAAGDVGALLAEMKTRKVEGVVIDMRGNGGGYLGDAVELTGALIDRGPVVQIEDAKGRREVLSDDEAGTAYDGPVVLLVDRFSASATEIVAGALQDYRRAVVVGTSATHGKGTVQSVLDLDRFAGRGSDLGVFKLTIQQFFRVSGASTQREGVTPDVILPDPFGHLETGERTLDHAVPWKQIDAASYTPWGGRWDVAALSARSATRVAKDKGFAQIAALARTFAARSKETRVPLARGAYEAYRKAQRDAVAASERDIDKDPARFTIKLLSDEALAAPTPGGKTDDRLSRWKTSLARDAWVAESLRVLDDLRAK